MAFAPTSTYFDQKATIIGIFDEKEYGNYFEFSHNDDDLLSYFGKEFPHKVWVTNASSDDRGYRYATVKKTVAYVVIDEDDNGEPVIEKWNIKGHRIYENKSK